MIILFVVCGCICLFVVVFALALDEYILFKM